MTENTTTTTIETPAATLAPTHAHANGKPVGAKKAKLAAHKAKKAAKAGKPAAKAEQVTATKEVKPATAKAAGGLTGKQIAILGVLAKGAASKKELGAPAKILGAATREEYGVQGGGMIGAGLIRSIESQGEGRCWYQITAAGTKALAKAKATAAAK